MSQMLDDKQISKWFEFEKSGKISDYLEYRASVAQEGGTEISPQAQS